jgi:Leucine-rich repeat (LRR) protein
MKSLPHLSFSVTIALICAVFVFAMQADVVKASSINTFSCTDVIEIPQIECEALVALYNITNGGGWTDHSNWLVISTPNEWYGVTVEAGHVTQLDLSSNQLSGSIPPQLGNLTSLKKLNLHSNQLSGSIPPELGGLTKLTYLALSWNGLTGAIPLALSNLTNLQELLLYGNGLTGSIPPELSELTNLTGLYLGANFLSGSIPPELGTLSNLTALSLYTNQLSGSIPSEMGSLSNLEGLNLSQNRLSGNIPSEIGTLSQLRLLWLQNNKLSGDIPTSLLDLVNLADPGQYGGDDGLSLDYNRLNVPGNYPDPGDPLQVFLYQKDPDWHLSQLIYSFFMPVVAR